MELSIAQQITADDITRDARLAVNNVASQRYSVERDSWVTLRRAYDMFVMLDQRTQAEHTLFVSVTDEARLTAHWAGFLIAHKATR